VKFNCGPSKAERWRQQQEWHPWFAWLPVRIAEGDCRWLEEVGRRIYRDWYGYATTEYRSRDK